MTKKRGKTNTMPYEEWRERVEKTYRILREKARERDRLEELERDGGSHE